MIAAAVQCDIDGIPKGSHYVSVPPIRVRLALWAFRVFGAGVEGFDDGGDASAGAEVADDLCPDGIAGFDDVVEDLVDDVLLKDAEVAVCEEILLEGLELEAGLAGHVADGEAAEVGQAGLGADGGELGVVDEDFVGAELVAPGFNGREFDVETGGGVVVGVAAGVLLFLFAHRSILSGLSGPVREGSARSKGFEAGGG
jgi:hypothetical protein